MSPAALFSSSLASSSPCPPHRPNNLQSHSPSPPFSSSAKPLNPPPPPPLKLSPQEITPSHLSSEKPPWLPAGAVKMPTAPWMRGPLLLPADQVLDLSNPRKKNKPHGGGDDDGDDHPARDRSLTDNVRGGRSRQAMLGIIRSITKLREIHPVEVEENALDAAEPPEFSVPLDIGDDEGPRRPAGRTPWVGVEKKLVFRREKKVRQPTAAELTLPEDVLFRPPAPPSVPSPSPQKPKLLFSSSRMPHLLHLPLFFPRLSQPPDPVLRWLHFAEERCHGGAARREDGGGAGGDLQRAHGKDGRRPVHFLLF